MGSESKTSRRHTIAAQRRQEIIRLRREGFTLREIGDAVGCSPQYCHSTLTAELERLAVQTERDVTALRCLENARLDLALQKIWPEVELGNLRAVDRVLRIMERRARLWGLDAPQKTAFTDPRGVREYGACGLASLLREGMQYEPQ